MKKILSIMVTVLMFISSIVSPITYVAAESAATYVFSNVDCKPGETVDVDITYSSSEVANLIAISRMKLSTADAEIVGFEFSDAAKAVINTGLSNFDPSTMSIVTLFNTPQTFNDVLGTLKVKFSETAEHGNVTISGTARVQNEGVGDVSSSVVNGTVFVTGEGAKFTFDVSAEQVLAGDTIDVVVKFTTDMESNLVAIREIAFDSIDAEIVGFEFAEEIKTVINTGLSNYDPNTKSLIVLFNNAQTYDGVIGTLKVKVAENASAGDIKISAGSRVQNETGGWDVPTDVVEDTIPVVKPVVKYTVTYKVDGEIVKEFTEIEEGSPVPTYDYAVAEGYTFSGWGELPATVTENLVIEGTTTINTYTVTYKVNGEAVKTENVVYGEAIPSYNYEVAEGYTFSGWDAEVPATMPAKNLEFNGTTTANTYTLIYKVNGEVVKTEEVVYGAAIPAYNYEVAEGYTFSGWDAEVPATMPAKNLEFNGTTTANTYTVTYKVNGEVVNTANVVYGEAIPAYEYTAEEGYTFSGWDAEVPATMPAENLEFNATTTANTYTVIYKVNGEVVKTEEVVYGAAIPAYNYEVAEGYTFSGWDAEVPATMPAKNLEFNGTTTANTYTVTYKVNGEVVNTANVVYGEAIPAYEYTAEEGYTFSGWDAEVPATMPAENLEFNATTTANTYTVIYKVNGEVVKTEEVVYGAAIPAYNYEVAEGYTFSGWDAEVPATMPAENLEFNATTTIKTFTVIYKVDGVEVAKFENVAYGAEVPEHEYTAEEGKTFSGWGELPAKVTEDLVIEGTTSGKTFTVIYKVNGEEVGKFENVAYGAEVPACNYEAEEGYIFSGWGELPAKVTEDLVIEATTTIKTFTVIYKVDGEEVAKFENVEYGAEVPAYNYEVADGYTFSGWGELPEKVTEDLVIEGTTEEIIEPARQKGDIDGDGVLSSKDAIKLLNYIVLPDYFDISDYLAVYDSIDFNNDGKVTSKDAIYLINSIAIPALYSLN